MACDVAEAASDVDLLVEVTRSVGLFHILRTADRVADMLGGAEIDLVERKFLSDPPLRPRVPCKG